MSIVLLVSALNFTVHGTQLDYDFSLIVGVCVVAQSNLLAAALHRTHAAPSDGYYTSLSECDKCICHELFSVVLHRGAFKNKNFHFKCTKLFLLEYGRIRLG